MFIIIYITNPTRKEAKKIAKQLLAKKLIACGNIFSSESIYNWKNKLVSEKEYILIAKTVNKNYEKIKKEVQKMHSYEIPCILKISATSNKKYLDWVVNVTKTQKHGNHRNHENTKSQKYYL